MAAQKPIKESYEGYAIMNHVGSFWSHNYFHDRHVAVEYIRIFQKNNPWCDLKKHKVVPVKLTMEQLVK